MSNLKNPIGIINPQALQKKECFLFDINFEMIGDQFDKVFVTRSHIIFWCDNYNIFTKQRCHTQEEFPISALPWFIDTIEHEYWNIVGVKEPKPKTLCEITTIDGEEIGISAMAHCCAENLAGYSFWNKSRINHITELPPQSWQIPKYMLKEGVLDQLKQASTRLGLKDYS